MLLSLEHHRQGWRVRVLRQRIHHGATGCVLLFFRRTRALGLVLCLHDIADIRAWFRQGWQD